MKVNLLKENYKEDKEFYNSFLNDSLEADGFISNDTILMPDIEPFPIYFGASQEKDDPDTLLDLIIFFKDNFIDLDMNIYMNELVLHSLIITNMREYILDKYPKIKDGENFFKIIVTRKFDWENYMYKAALIAKYVSDSIPDNEQMEYFQLIIENLDIFNYIIKNKIFRNNDFFIKFFNVVKKENLSYVLKSKFKDSDNPLIDLRIGRLVIQDFSNAYPALLSPLLPQEEFDIYFMKFLNHYY